MERNIMAHDHEDLQVGWMNNARFFGTIFRSRQLSVENRTFFFTSAGELLYTEFNDVDCNHLVIDLIGLELCDIQRFQYNRLT